MAQGYDGIGRLDNISDPANTYLSIPASGGYNAANQPLAVSYGSGVAGTFAD